MVAYLVKYTAQERGAYISGVLSAHLSQRTAHHTLTETCRDLLAKGWNQTDELNNTFVTAKRTLTLYIEELTITD